MNASGAVKPNQRRRFYSYLFGWHIQNMPEIANYGMVDVQEGRGIGGGVAIEGSSFVTFNVEVDDPQAYLDKAVSLGGQVAMPVTDMETVTIAQFRDREGHMVGIVKKQPDQ